MDTKSRTALAPILASCLLTGFSGEQYDDFVNYAYNGHTLRVVRFVGPGRCMLVFKYATLPQHRNSTNYWYGQTLSFLALDGSLVPFDHKAVEAEWNAKNPGKTCSWERIVSDWVVAHGAQEFRGANWVGRISAALVPVTLDWLKAHGIEQA